MSDRAESFRTDNVYFNHTDHKAGKDVKFHTSHNFHMQQPIKCEEYIINDKFKIIESGDELIFQKKVDGEYVTAMVLG